MSSEVFDYLDDLGISYNIAKHKPVFTVEEARKYREDIDGLHCKNLFLEDSKRGNYYLLTTPADKTFRLNNIRKQIKAKKLSLASPESMKEIIGLTPGATSPFGLINDTSNTTNFLVDKGVWDAPVVTFHPNDNAMTISLSGEDFHSFVNSLENTYRIITIQ